VFGRYRTGYAPASPLLRPDRKAEGMAQSAELAIRRFCGSQSATRLSVHHVISAPIDILFGRSTGAGGELGYPE